MNKPASSASLMDQAGTLDEIISRCILRNGDAASISDLTLYAEDVEKLKSISERLWLMSSFEGAIKRLVAGR